MDNLFYPLEWFVSELIWWASSSPTTHIYAAMGVAILVIVGILSTMGKERITLHTQEDEEVMS